MIPRAPPVLPKEWEPSRSLPLATSTGKRVFSSHSPFFVPFSGLAPVTTTVTHAAAHMILPGSLLSPLVRQGSSPKLATA